MGDALISAVANRMINEIVNKVGNEDNVVGHLAEKLQKVNNILVDADKKGFMNKSTKDWLKRLEKACYQMEDVLDKWKYAVRQQQIDSKHKVCCIIPSPSSCLSFKRVSSSQHIVNKIEQVIEKLDQILAEEVIEKLTQILAKKAKSEYQRNQPADKVQRVSTSFVEEVVIYGRESDKKVILDAMLDDEGVSRDQSRLKVISLVGPGGIGKTTLAQLIFKDSRVVACYPLKMWVYVSDSFEIKEIVIQILAKVESSPYTRERDLDSLLQRLKSFMKDKKFLLVLDDVWRMDSTKWEPLFTCLECGGMGSKIMVTTRYENVAEEMGKNRDWDVMQYAIPRLTDEECWSILSRIALPELSETERWKYEKIGREIVIKCQGLPLGAKTLGSLLREKGGNLAVWESVAKSEMWEGDSVAESEMKELEQEEMERFPEFLTLSYNELPLALKRCFSYCAVFPKDHVIDVDGLIRNWMALGYLGSQGESSERKGREYFATLANYSLFQEFIKNKFNETLIVECKMQNIIHEFATSLRSTTETIVQGQTCKKCSASLVSQVEEYRSLLCLQKPLGGICDCLANTRTLYLTKFNPPNGLETLMVLRSLYLKAVDGISAEELKIIFKLYNLETLILRDNDIKEIPEEIGNLIWLGHLDLSGNKDIKVLPESVCNLQELGSLNIERCTSLNFPDEVIGQLSGLHTLTWFQGRLIYLQDLDKLRGSLTLRIEGDMGVEEDVIQAKGAQLSKKKFLNQLEIRFSTQFTYLIRLRTPVEKEMIIKNAEDVLDDLEPHPNLTHLLIYHFEGSKLSKWISLPSDNHLKFILLEDCWYLTSLPPLGMLPSLEILRMYKLREIEFVGREFLGIIRTTSTSVGSSSSLSAIGFPKLKTLHIEKCNKWNKWEDITNEEEASTTLSLFPCLEMLSIQQCPNIQMLPHRLLHKAVALTDVNLNGSRVEKEDIVQNSGDGRGVKYD